MTPSLSTFLQPKSYLLLDNIATPKNPFYIKKTIIICLFFIAIGIGHAQVFVNLHATGSNDGTSWVNAYTDIQEALDAADSGDQIWIAAGTYIPGGHTPDSSHYYLTKRVQLYGGFTGTETHLGERNWQGNHTILSGDKNNDDLEGEFLILREDNAHHVLIIDAGDQEVVLDGLQFRGGTTRLDAFAPDSTDFVGIHRWRGGAVFIQNTPTMIRNCIFRDNFGYDGSALLAKNLDLTSEDLIIENSIFELNGTLYGAPCYLTRMDSCVIRKTVFRHNESGVSGGALIVFNSNAVIHDCLFEDNFSGYQAGACFLLVNSSSQNPHPVFDFARCQFIENSTLETGGAVQIGCFKFGFDLTFDSCSFLNNFGLSNGSYGGALYILDYPDDVLTELSNQIKFKECIFSENSSGYGGAFEIDGSDDSLYIQIEDSHFIGNACFNANSEGGGIYIWQFLEGKTFTKIDNSLFSGNFSASAGGAIFSSYKNSHPQTYEINNCIFNENEAIQNGGAIWTNSIMGLASSIGSIKNSQFTGNISTAGGAIISAGDSLIVENCNFIGNQTVGSDSELSGAAAIHCYGKGNVIINNSSFHDNISESESGAITFNSEVNSTLENVMLRGNIGNGTIVNWGNMVLRNITMIDNETGLLVQDSSYTEIQNSVFNNEFDNMFVLGISEIISKGGNISSDESMTDVLTGYGGFDDFHETDPLLSSDLVPLIGSPCIDAGNAEGVTTTLDLAGNPRIYGNGIDVGAYESFLVAVNDAVWGAKGFTVFPNPVKDVLHFKIESEWIGEVKLMLYNYMGHLVMRTSVIKAESVQSFSQDLNHMPPGEYVLLANSETLTYAVNIIIQR